MAITGAAVVQDALIGLGVLDAGATVSTADSDYMLRLLNRMVDDWATQDLMIYGLTEDSFTMTPGTASYSSALLTTMGRPVSINSMFVRLGGIDYPVDMVDVQSYDDIAYKTTTGIPNQCYVRWNYPNLSMTFYPVPYAAFTCFVNGVTPLNATAITAVTSLDLPKGYERALVNSLQVEAAPAYGVQMSPIAIKNAMDGVANLKRLNYEPLRMSSDLSDGSISPSAFIYQGF
jgi:hypothetical protein